MGLASARSLSVSFLDDHRPEVQEFRPEVGPIGQHREGRVSAFGVFREGFGERPRIGFAEFVLAFLAQADQSGRPAVAVTDKAREFHVFRGQGEFVGVCHATIIV
jgi:hypothetical protein